MPAEVLSMRKVREVLRLKHALGMSYGRSDLRGDGGEQTQAAACVRKSGVGGESVGRCPGGLDDAEPERRVSPALKLLPAPRR